VQITSPVVLNEVTIDTQEGLSYTEAIQMDILFPVFLLLYQAFPELFEDTPPE
jgi:hypothetical protein